MPIKDKFLPNTLETVYLYNDKTKKKAYYGFPLKQQTMHILYWKDMLAEAGYRPTSRDMEGILGVLVRQGAARHRKKTGKRTLARASRWASIRATPSTRS